MNTQQEYEKLKKEGVSKILEDANGSWYDLVNDGFDLAEKLRQSTQPIAAEEVWKKHLVNYYRSTFQSSISDDDIYKKVRLFHDEKIIIAAMKEYASQPKGAGVWVKASERLPDKIRVCVKYNGDADVIYKYKDEWAFDNSDGMKIFPEDWSAIEWLDEYSSLPSQEGQQ